MKIGISGAVGIGKTWFAGSLNNSIFLAVEEAARQVNSMYPNKDISDLREIIFHHQLAVEEVIDKLAEDVIAVCDRTVIDNIAFLELFSGAEIAQKSKKIVKDAYLKSLKKYDAVFYLDYGKVIDPDLLRRTLSDDFRKKTLGKFAGIDKFMDFNKKFRDVFLEIADELGIPVLVISADYDVYSLSDRNQMLSEAILNNFLGV